MNVDVQILSDQIRSLLLILDRVLPAVKWNELPADSEDMVAVGLLEARESIGESATCEGGTCAHKE